MACCNYFGRRDYMAYKKRNNISEVSFTYIGTDDQFNDFLKMILHDYLAMDNPYAVRESEAEKPFQ